MLLVTQTWGLIDSRSGSRSVRTDPPVLALGVRGVKWLCEELGGVGAAESEQSRLGVPRPRHRQLLFSATMGLISVLTSETSQPYSSLNTE